MVIFALLIYLIYPLIEGRRGIRVFLKTHDEIALAKQHLQELQKEHDYLLHKIYLMHPESLDPDILKENAFKMLHMTAPNEYLIPFNQELIDALQSGEF